VQIQDVAQEVNEALGGVPAARLDRALLSRGDRGRPHEQLPQRVHPGLIEAPFILGPELDGDIGRMRDETIRRHGTGDATVSRRVVGRRASRKGVPPAEKPVLADRRALLASRLMAPTYRMPHPLGLWAQATVAEITDALHAARCAAELAGIDRKSTRLNSSHDQISYAVFCLKKKKK